MQYMDQQRGLPPPAQRIATIGQGLPGTSDPAAVLMSRYRVHHYPTHGEIFPGCHPGLPGGLIMRPALPHLDKEQSYPTSLQSLSPADAEVLYNCMDPKLWAESMINPMMLPPMFDSYYNGLDFHAPGYRKNVTKETTGPLKAWLQDHRKNPYPTKAEKIMLAIITKMTLTQVSTWFANARRRLKKETGSRICSEDGDDKSLSDDDDDIAISETKQDSDDEADCEISVDDEEDVDVFTVIPRDIHVTSTSERPNTGLSPASRGMTREYIRSQSMPYEIPRRIPHLDHTDRGPNNLAKSSNCLARYHRSNINLSQPLSLCPESDIKPVDLSPRASVSRVPLKHCQQQHQRDHQVEQQQQSPEMNQNQLRDNIHDSQQSGSKVKIWSISNILSIDSDKKQT